MVPHIIYFRRKLQLELKKHIYHLHCHILELQHDFDAVAFSPLALAEIVIAKIERIQWWCCENGVARRFDLE